MRVPVEVLHAKGDGSSTGGEYCLSGTSQGRYSNSSLVSHFIMALARFMAILANGHVWCARDCGCVKRCIRAVVEA